jgi:hypothetical protein
MSFSLVTLEDKSRILNAAKAEFQAEVWKHLAKLGHDPDTYDISTWSFDADAVEPDSDPEYQSKKSISLIISRLANVEQKIAELS